MWGCVVDVLVTAWLVVLSILTGHGFLWSSSAGSFFDEEGVRAVQNLPRLCWNDGCISYFLFCDKNLF